jgi:hypothetical protein
MNNVKARQTYQPPNNLPLNTIYRITDSGTQLRLSDLSSLNTYTNITSDYCLFDDNLYINGIKMTGYCMYNHILYNNGVKTGTTYYKGTLYYNNEWTYINVPTLSGLYTSITYGNGFFVVVSGSGQILYS